MSSLVLHVNNDAGRNVARGAVMAKRVPIPSVTKTFRLPAEIMKRLADYRAAIEERAGVPVTETAVLVQLLRRALDEAEPEERAFGLQPKKPAKPKP